MHYTKGGSKNGQWTIDTKIGELHAISTIWVHFVFNSFLDGNMIHSNTMSLNIFSIQNGEEWGLTLKVNYIGFFLHPKFHLGLFSI
jgi:hypothetical protein